MKFNNNWRSFMFNMGVILFALIAVNLMSSGVKMEGFEEGAVDVNANCQKKVPKLADLDAVLAPLATAGTLYNGNNVNYSQLGTYSDVQGQCNGYIVKKYKAPPKPPAKPKAAPAKAAPPKPKAAPKKK